MAATDTDVLSIGGATLQQRVNARVLSYAFAVLLVGIAIELLVK